MTVARHRGTVVRTPPARRPWRSENGRFCAAPRVFWRPFFGRRDRPGAPVSMTAEGVVSGPPHGSFRGARVRGPFSAFRTRRRRSARDPSATSRRRAFRGVATALKGTRAERLDDRSQAARQRARPAWTTRPSAEGPPLPGGVGARTASDRRRFPTLIRHGSLEDDLERLGSQVG